MTSSLTAEEAAKLDALVERVSRLEAAALNHETELVRINGEAAGLVAALRAEFEALRVSAEETRRTAELAAAAASASRGDGGALAGTVTVVAKAS